MPLAKGVWMDSKPPHRAQEPGLTGLRATPLPDALRPAASLPPKGACWYCDKPLDAVRRFCCKSCGEAYVEETQYSR